MRRFVKYFSKYSWKNNTEFFLLVFVLMLVKKIKVNFNAVCPKQAAPSLLE
jgi:hypothetical protein